MDKETLFIQAAHARDKNTFMIALSEGFDEDYFSIVLRYNGGIDQPWSRYELNMNIASLKNYDRPDDPGFVLLSEEGDVTFIRKSGKMIETITGAGLHNEDATGLGYTTNIEEIDGALLIGGMSAQLYQYTQDGWHWFNKPKRPLPSPTYSRIDFGRFAGTSLNDLYAATSEEPIDEIRDKTPEEREAFSQAAAKSDIEAMKRINRKVEGEIRKRKERLHHWNGEEWREVAVPPPSKYDPSPAPIYGLLVEDTNKVWAVGHNGTILFGNARDGFANVSPPGQSYSLKCPVLFQDQLMMIAGNMLCTFDDHQLKPLKPKIDPNINRGVPRPLKIQVVDDVLMYFDKSHGVSTWDGETWQQIPIPPELLELEFKGLKPKN
ncbi:hypothetical protein ACQU0X_31805 [Pseudovibrio ascidiaceicola]|uniref:hypothetical protein n=1 Tax=Pseudovibrio ascidiaceicola TaxID=285279 RepID=UPI003D35B06B